jgi:hypothetical protein
MVGMANTTEIGPVAINLPRRLCPEGSAPTPTAARLLQVIMISDEAGVEIRTTAVTEAFWVSGGEDDSLQAFDSEGAV